MEAACQVREVVVAGRLPSLAGVAEVAGEACLDRRAVGVVVEAFQAREEAVEVHQILQVAVEEVAEVEVGTGVGAQSYLGVEEEQVEEEVEEMRTVASERTLYFSPDDPDKSALLCPL